MSILNVNTIQPVGSGQTITVSATNISAPSTVVTASRFVGDVTGNVTGNLNSTGVTTVTNLTATNITVGTAGTAITTVSVGSSVGIGSTLPQTKLDVVGGIKGVIITGTSQVSTAGTSIDFTGIPSWVKRVTIMFDGVSTTGTSRGIIQIGTSSGIEGSGYSGGGGWGVTTGANSIGFYAEVLSTTSAAYLRTGAYYLTSFGSNTWVLTGTVWISSAEAVSHSAGLKTLSGALNRIRVTTVTGTETFDAGNINISYEG